MTTSRSTRAKQPNVIAGAAGKRKAASGQSLAMLLYLDASRGRLLTVEDGPGSPSAAKESGAHFGRTPA